MNGANRLDTYFTPTTCFAVACAAFSLVTISTIWRNARYSEFPTETKVHRDTQARPQPQRWSAADSLCAKTQDADSACTPQRVATLPRRESRIAKLVSLGARVARSLQSCLREPERVELLDELSLLTTLLCRLQQGLFTNQEFLNGYGGLSACFEATTSSLEATFLSLDASLSNEIDSVAALGNSLQRLRDQRSSLDILLRSSQATAMPLTPPLEEDVASTLRDKDVTNLQLDPAPINANHTGLTPYVNHRYWIEPPPKYSPSTKSSSPVSFQKGSCDIKMPMTLVRPLGREGTGDAGGTVNDAVARNDSKVLAQLLAEGADPNVCFGELQRTPLHQAAHQNHYTCLSVLLRYGASTSSEDAKGDTAIHLAAWAGNTEALAELVAYGADVDWLSGRDGYSPLWCAISAYQIDAARLLLRCGARVSLRSASGGGLMPLHQAAVTGQGAMTDLLLNCGARLDCVDDDGNTPLHYAAASGSVYSVSILLRWGADMEASQTHGLTPLHWAAHKGHSEVLGVLLDFGARLDERTNEGATALHLAANRGHVGAARVLLERGACHQAGLASWDNVKGTPAEMAQAKGHAQLARILNG